MEEETVLNRIDRLERIYAQQLTQVVSAESVVPDTMPDVAAIVLSDARVFVRTGSLTEGAVELQGTVEGTVLYLPEGSDVPEKLEVSIPVVLTGQNGQIDKNCRLVFSSSVTGAEARAVNCRKISFRAEVCADTAVYRPGVIDLTADTGELAPLEVLPEETEVGFIREIGEKNFTVADELELPTSIEKILWYQTQLFAENTKKVGGKTILQGGVELQLLYLPNEDESIRFERFRIPFSQLMDLEQGEGDQAASELRTVSCFVEILPGLNRSDSVSMELQLSAQLLLLGEHIASYISDAYSLHCPLEVTRSMLDAAGPYGMSTRKTTVKEQIKVPEQAKEIVFVSVCMTPCAVFDSKIGATANVCVLYRTDAGLRSAVKKIPVEFPAAAAGTDFLNCKANCGECYTSLQGEAIGLQFDVELVTVSADRKSISYVSRLEAGDTPETEKEYPSIVAVRPGGRSLWELAKTYRSTVALIESANPSELNTDSLLLIPRGR